jgi:predicted nucleic acid-binding protein
MIVVSDSTPLIQFAKAGCMEILVSLYEDILITNEVYREVVVEGNLLEKEDAVIIQKCVGKNIHVRSPGSSSGRLVEKYLIHKGEADSIQLAKEMGARLILMNEREGRIAAKSEGLKVKGSIGILFDAIKAGIVDENGALSILSKFRDNPQVFWIEPDIIKAAMEKIQLKK